MSRKQMIEMALRNIAHVEAGTVDQESDVFRVPATNYYDPERWRLEVDRIFKRLPLMLALGGELRGPGSYKALDAVGVPVLLTRGADGAVRAFVNMCSHRGAVVVADGLGTARNFSCPYHGWTYDPDGALVGITDRKDFGELDASCRGLTPLPVAERAGMIFVVVTPGAELDIDTFLCGYDEPMSYFDFGSWHLVSRKQLVGPNWKVAYDGYLDFYHLPILHKASFGPNMSRKALYDRWGPHQRVTAPSPALLELRDKPQSEWDIDALSGGVWTVFPHVSFAGGPAGGLISQLFPGPTPDRSLTIQSYFSAREPANDEERAAAQGQADFLERVVRDEDYATGLRIQQAVETGTKTEFLFGRNEGGGQCFHGWVERLVGAEDGEATARVFAEGRAAR
jgi:nitrite reductase/ring-hydroxylating ferredoxin subunit